MISNASATVILLATVVLQQTSDQSAELPKCDSRVVLYTDAVPEYRSRISVEHGGEFQESGDDSAIKSPQGTRRFVLRQADFMKAGPWTSTLYVKGNPGSKNFLKMRFSDHASYGVRPQWLNEKLLYIEVWWGRVLATDLIVDIETGEIRYQELARFDQMIAPCDGSDRPR